MSAIVTWFFTTPLGRTILLSLVTAITAGACWWGFSSHFKEVGRQECQAEHDKALAEANVGQAAANTKSDNTSAAVGQQAVASTNKVVQGADTKAAATNQEIRDAYRQIPKTAPVALGSCVHPLDERVQNGIDGAVNRANKSP